MGSNDIIKRVLDANPAQLAKVAAVLDGAEVAKEKVLDDREDGLLMLSKAARLLGVSRTSIYSLIAQGRLDVVTLTGNQRVTRRSVEEFLIGHRPETKATRRLQREYARKWHERKRQVKSPVVVTAGGAR